MTELSRSLLAAAREGLAPDAAVAARVRAKVAAAVGASAAATGSLAAIPGKASTTAIVVKIGAALLTIGIVAAVVVVARPQRAPEMPGFSVTPREDEVRSEIRVVAPTGPSSERAVAPPHSKHTTPALDVAATTAPNASPTRHATTGVDPDAIDPDAIELDGVEDAAPSAAKRKGKHATDSDDGDAASLAREVELIDLAMVSLKKRAPHAALEAIKAYERETHGRGQMAEDAAAIEIEARCNMDLDATAAIARFDRKWPESAQRERIQTACFAKP